FSEYRRVAEYQYQAFWIIPFDYLSCISYCSHGTDCRWDITKNFCRYIYNAFRVFSSSDFRHFLLTGFYASMANLCCSCLPNLLARISLSTNSVRAPSSRRSTDSIRVVSRWRDLTWLVNFWDTICPCCNTCSFPASIG